MGKTKKSNTFINLLIVFCVLIVLQLGCNWKNFTNSESQTNSTDNKPDNSDSSKTTGKLSASCNNPYYPVGETVQRKYRVTYPKSSFPTKDYTESFSDFNNDTFVVKTEFDNVKSSVNWRCTPDGLLPTQYNNNSIEMKSGANVKIETLESKGVTVPNERLWKDGEKWSADYNIKETINNQKGEKIGEGEGTVNQSAEVTDTEEVTVPAGKFQTVKVKITTTIDITVKVNGVSVPTKVPLETTVWFAKDTGMVKSVTNLMGMGNATTEMLSIQK